MIIEREQCPLNSLTCSLPFGGVAENRCKKERNC